MPPKYNEKPAVDVLASSASPQRAHPLGPLALLLRCNKLSWRLALKEPGLGFRGQALAITFEA